MRKVVLIAVFGLLTTLGVGSAAYAHDGPHPYEYCGHANHYTDYGYGAGSYGAYTWEGYLGHGDYENSYGGETHWHLYETWTWSDYYGDWFFYDYEWRQC